MALENLTNGAVLEDVFNQISFLTTLFQAIGGLVILYIIFNIINMIVNRKKNKEIKLINKNLEDIKKLLQRRKK